MIEKFLLAVIIALQVLGIYFYIKGVMEYRKMVKGMGDSNAEE